MREDQLKELHEKIKILREQNASHEDIKATVKSMFESWGIDLPENWDQMPGFHPFRHDRMPFVDHLKEDQRKQIQYKIKELREQNNIREEIRAAIGEILKQFGTEPPEGRRWNKDGQPEPDDGNRFDAKKKILKI